MDWKLVKIVNLYAVRTLLGLLFLLQFWYWAWLTIQFIVCFYKSRYLTFLLFWRVSNELLLEQTSLLFLYLWEFFIGEKWQVNRREGWNHIFVTICLLNKFIISLSEFTYLLFWCILRRGQKLCLMLRKLLQVFDFLLAV